MSAALISTAYTVDDGNNYNGTYFRGGKVEVSNPTCYSHNGDCPSLVTIIHALAHVYGEMSLASECGHDTDISDVMNSKPSPSVLLPAGCDKARIRLSFQRV